MPVYTQIAQGTGTAIGDLTNTGGLAAAYDGVTSQTRAAAATKGAGDRTTGTIGKNWGGSTFTISQVILYGCSDFAGFSDSAGDSVQFIIEGSNNNFTNTVTLYTGSSFTPTANQVVTINTGLDTSAAYSYHRVRYVKSISTSDCMCAELRWYYTPPAAMPIFARPARFFRRPY